MSERDTFHKEMEKLQDEVSAQRRSFGSLIYMYINHNKNTTTQDEYGHKSFSFATIFAHKGSTF